jgi:hypothetical protein
MRFGAFSSESLPRTRCGVETGSREENASNKEAEPPFRFNRIEGFGMCGRCFGIVNPDAAMRAKVVAGSADMLRQARFDGSSGLRDSSIQNHSKDCAFRGESPLSDTVASCRQQRGIVMGECFDNRGDGARWVLGLRC